MHFVWHGTQDDDEDYNFEEDLKNQKEWNEDSCKRMRVCRTLIFVF